MIYLPNNPELVNIRITYKNAPIHLLEKFTFKDINKAHDIFFKNLKLDECLILQTCNRVEIFALSDKIDSDELIKQWTEISHISIDDFKNIAEIDRDKNVIRHILRLVSGLDSLVLGEDQILGQVKRAYDFSKKNSYLDSNFSFIFEKAIKVGSKVRTLTGINKGSVSVGSVAVNLAEELLGNIEKHKILLIGSGEGASLVAKSLNKRDITFINTSRTYERAKSFSETVGGTPIDFEKALDSICDFDLIFVSTTAPYFLLSYDKLEKSVSKRNRPLLIFDLSNPRAVDEKVAQINNINLINMDEIAKIVDGNIKFRKQEIQSAERIIEDEMANMDLLIKRKKADPLVVSVFRQADKIRDRELKKALTILGEDIGSKEAKIIEQFSHALLDGIISTPMNNLRRELQDECDGVEEHELIKMANKLFNYENETHTS